MAAVTRVRRSAVLGGAAVVALILLASAPGPATANDLPGSPQASGWSHFGPLGRGSAARPTSPVPFSIVNPERYTAAEPAPMGIADFGVTGKGAGATGYSYASAAFQGEAQVQSMSLTVSGSSSRVAAFELNAVVVLELGGVNYSYWIQNGLHLDASSHQFTIGGAYVWNFSSAGAHLVSGELQGAAGSALATDTYYDIPGCSGSFPGQCSTLSLPADLTGRILTGEATGTPYIDYEYDVGSGWVTYDNVSFPRMTGAHDIGFLVDGFATTPYSSGLYYDAEWVWVGAGGGSTGVDQASNIGLTLSFWNGHNFQAVPTAWNFGSNTGERNSNVTDTFAPSPTGVPSASLAPGPGSLGLLYNGTSAGFANVTGLTAQPETISVDGEETTFSGQWANLTLQGGTHTITLENYTNSTQQFVVVPGATTPVNFSGAGAFDFVETGLPAGTPWGVDVNGTQQTAATRSIRFNLPDGTYPVSYLLVPGFHLNGSFPRSVTLPASTSVSLEFVPTTYTVLVQQSGLPGDTPWWVLVNGTEFRTTAQSIPLNLPNGSVPYAVGAAYAFVATPSNGTIVVIDGVAAPVTVEFSARPCYLEGTVSPENATVTLNGSPVVVSAGSFDEELPSGQYLLLVTASGYSNQSMTVVLTPGNTSWANFSLSLLQAHHPGGGPGSVAPSSGLPLFWILGIGLGAVVLGAAAALALRRSRGPRT